MQKPVIVIHYCTQCNWLLRSAWMAQELLQTFAQDLASVTLRPGTGGVFEITLDEHLLWNANATADSPMPRRLSSG